MMDQQNNKPNHVPTEEEIARMEAEAARHLAKEAAEKPDKQAFVPYVDDVPAAPKPARPAAQPAAAAQPDDDDDDDGEYIPSEWEKRIDRLTPAQWKRWQIIGGAAVGAAAFGSLFLFGQELATYGIIVAVLLALLLPRYLEKSWRRSLNTARIAMLVAMAVVLVVMILVMGMRTGFTFKSVQ